MNFEFSAKCGGYVSYFENIVFKFCALLMQSLSVSIIEAICACRAREFIFDLTREKCYDLLFDISVFDILIGY